jgi:hypothetical protein
MPKKPVEVLFPADVEKQNIITKKEIAATILALRYALNPAAAEPTYGAVQRRRDLIESAMAKFERTLAEFGST